MRLRSLLGLALRLLLRSRQLCRGLLLRRRQVGSCLLLGSLQGLLHRGKLGPASGGQSGIV